MVNSISIMRPELVPEWSPRNLPLTPDNVSYGSNKLYWWKGSCGHEWQSRALNVLSVQIEQFLRVTMI